MGEKMKAKMLIYNLVARDIKEAMDIIRKDFPNSRMITYKYDVDFRFEKEKNYRSRTMTVAFIDDIDKIVLKVKK